MQTLSFQQNTGFNPGALIKRNQAKVADHDGIRSAVLRLAAAEGQDVVSAYIIDMSERQQGGEEIEFPADISRARQKLFRYPDNEVDSEKVSRECASSDASHHGRPPRWNFATACCLKTISCPDWHGWRKRPAKRRLPLPWELHVIKKLKELSEGIVEMFRVDPELTAPLMAIVTSMLGGFVNVGYQRRKPRCCNTNGFQVQKNEEVIAR